MLSYIGNSFSIYFSQWRHIPSVILVLLVGICIQLIKVCIDIFKYKTFYFHHFFSSWGFPSFHTWLASSVTMLVLLEYGFDSIFFTIAFAFSLLFAYDAMNIRYEAWQHAYYINTLRTQLQDVLFKEAKKPLLKERIWHTPLEVFGGIIFGSLLTLLFYYLMYIR